MIENNENVQSDAVTDEATQASFQSAFEDNKNSNPSPAVPATNDAEVRLSVPENTDVVVDDQAEAADADTTHQATPEQVEGQE